MNGNRPKLRRLLSDPSVMLLVVEHRDRLARFGVEHLEAVLAAHGRSLLVLDSSEGDGDLLAEVLTLMCARLYGRRSARIRAEAAMTATEVRPR